MCHVEIKLSQNSVNIKDSHEDQETLAGWKRKFLFVVEQGNQIESLRQCLASLPLCSSRFNDESDKNAETNRGNFILETLHNSNEKKVLQLLSNQEGDTASIKATLKSQGYFTPFFLADLQAVRCMVQSKCRFGLPDKPSNNRDEQRDDGLNAALTSLNRYVALVDPIYISACFLEAGQTEESVDPVSRSFELHEQLLTVAEREFEFKSEYNKLREQCKCFAVEILGKCDNLEPDIRCVLESEGTSERNDPMDILFLAILNRNKEFVSHPYSQLLLNAEIYREMPALQKSNWLFFGLVVLIMFLLPVSMPVLTLLHVFCPQHKLAVMVSSPHMKFLNYVISYLVFVVFLLRNTTRPANELFHVVAVDHLTLIWFFGLAIDITIDLVEQIKRVRHKLSTSWMTSLQHVLSTGWNAIAMIFIPLYVATHTLWVGARSGMDEKDFAKLLRHEMPDSKMFPLWLVSLALFSFVYLLILIYATSFFVVNSYMGPLLHTLVEMVKEVLKFFLFFSLVYFAFSFSFKKLLLVYSYAVPEAPYTSFGGIMYTTFWALFGDLGPGSFNTRSGYGAIQYGGITLFGIYNVVAVLVAMNMLIAILNDAYINITDDLDRDWKFTRSTVWLNWIHKEEVIPPPFNLISILLKLLKRIYYSCKCVSSQPLKQKRISPEMRREVLQTLVQKYLEKETEDDSSSQ